MPLRPAHDRDVAALSRAWTEQSARVRGEAAPPSGPGRGSAPPSEATLVGLSLLAMLGLVALVLGAL